MIKRIIVLFFTIGSIAMANSFLETVKNIEQVYLKVQEKTFINNKKKEKTYLLKVKIPDTLFKEVLVPELNKGELYLYKNNKKIVYIPKLKQYTEKELENEENYIMMIFNDIKGLSSKKIINHQISYEDKDIIFSEDNSFIKEIKYKDNTSIAFEEYKDNFPVRFKVFDNGALISEILFIEVDTKIKFKESEFEVKKGVIR